MDINDARGIATVCSLIAFIGIIWWAFGSGRKARFEEDGNLPFADENHDAQPNKIGEERK